MTARREKKRVRAVPAKAETLEPRQLLAVAYPTPAEQYMVELYNWARMNPLAASAKYGVGLNEGPTAYPIASTPKQPLAINPMLTSAARSYGQYLIDVDLFTHTADGRDPAQRMQAEGYPFNSPGLSGENAGLSSLIGFTPEMQSVNLHFSSLFVDSTIGGRWHRLTMMDPGYKEIGSGIATGMWQGFNAFVSVQDLGRSGTGSFLTGVAYTDNSHDNFYTPGEQMGGATITAIRASDGATFSTTTWSSGGYSLSLPQGQYTVWGGGGTLGGWVRYDNVTIGDENVKRDFRPDLVGTDTGPQTFARLTNGQLILTGTSQAEVIEVDISDRVYAALNGDLVSFDLSQVSSVQIISGDGADVVIVYAAGAVPVSVDAGGGNDQVSLADNQYATVYGGTGNDTIYGSTGHDQIYGGAGDDWIYGYAGYDYLVGEDGSDHIYAGSGFDNLFGGNGSDSLFGQADNDTLDGGLGADYLVGGSGSDTADYSSRTTNLIISLENRYQGANDGELGEFDNVLDDIESVLGGSGNDYIVGSGVTNFISGGAGNDTLTGGAAFDLIFGGEGNDLLLAGDSMWDYIDGGGGIDEVRGDFTDVLQGVELFVQWVATPAPRPARDPFRPSIS